jgi:hypothetical protein
MRKVLLIIGIVLVVLGIGIYFMIQDAKYNTTNVDNTNLEVVGQEYSIISREHIKVGQQHDAYNSNPPTSGPHYEQPANWGIYATELIDEQLIHNLEHGGIWISYKNIDDDTLSKLKAIASSNPGSVILTPREKNDQPIVLASWGRLQSLESYDEAKILEFITHNKNKSPEPLAY